MSLIEPEPVRSKDAKDIKKSESPFDKILETLNSLELNIPPILENAVNVATFTQEKVADVLQKELGLPALFIREISEDSTRNLHLFTQNEEAYTFFIYHNQQLEKEKTRMDKDINVTEHVTIQSLIEAVGLGMILKWFAQQTKKDIRIIILENSGASKIGQVLDAILSHGLNHTPLERGDKNIPDVTQEGLEGENSVVYITNIQHAQQADGKPSIRLSELGMYVKGKSEPLILPDGVHTPIPTR